MDKNDDNQDVPSLGSEDGNNLDQGTSLEYSDSEATQTQSTVVAEGATSPLAQDGNSSDSPKDEPGKPEKSRFRRFWEHFNLYLLVFVFIIILATVATVVMYVKNRSASITAPGTLTQQDLPSETLQELAANGVQVGDPKQVLNVQSNSVFAGAVLVKGELQVAGGLKIGSGSLALPEINVGGTASINQLQAQSLDVSGNARVNELSVLRNLNVNGNGTFNGGLTTPQLSVGRLQLNGDLAITRHIVAAGATPGRSNGSALGGGGTSSVSGSDTAGSITINTGGSASAGCLATVNFTNAFASTPHVVITPVGSAAAGLNYYVNRSTNNFSVCTTSPPPSNSSFGFDYHAFE